MRISTEGDVRRSCWGGGGERRVMGEAEGAMWMLKGDEGKGSEGGMVMGKGG